MSEQHRHTNPSPSLDVGAWCNGTADERGCGQFRPLSDFDKSTWADYVEVYLIDGRIGEVVNGQARLRLIRNLQALWTAAGEVLEATPAIATTGSASEVEWERFHKATHRLWLEMGCPASPPRRGGQEGGGG